MKITLSMAPYKVKQQIRPNTKVALRTIWGDHVAATVLTCEDENISGMVTGHGCGCPGKVEIGAKNKL